MNHTTALRVRAIPLHTKYTLFQIKTGIVMSMVFQGINPAFKLTLTTQQAGECRRHVQNFKQLQQTIRIVEFHDNFWNHHEKCIQISTNVPRIGLVICE